jgi:long-subunit fatty acid transport protein
LNIISGNYKSTNDYFEDDTRNIYQGRTDPDEPDTEDFITFNLNRILDWDISGWDAKIGFLYQFRNNARFGLTVQFPKSFKIKEDFFVDGYSQFVNTTFFLDREKYSDAVEYNIITPIEFGGGFSTNYMGLVLSIQGTFIPYSQIEFENVSGLGRQFVEDLNRRAKDQLRTVINYNIGIEYNIPMTGLRVRGGFMVMPSPYQDDSSEFDRKYLTAGLGLLADETIGIDVAYAYGWWKDIGDNYGVNLSRTFHDVNSSQVIITGIYRF